MESKNKIISSSLESFADVGVPKELKHDPEVKQRPLELAEVMMKVKYLKEMSRRPNSERENRCRKDEGDRMSRHQSLHPNHQQEVSINNKLSRSSLPIKMEKSQICGHRK